MKGYNIEALIESNEEIIFKSEIPFNIVITNPLIYFDMDEHSEIISIKHIESIHILCEDFDFTDERYSSSLDDCSYYYVPNSTNNRVAIILRMGGGQDNIIIIVYDINKKEKAYKFYKALRTVWPTPAKLTKPSLYPKKTY